jgi:hypothetical protein
VPVVPVTQQKCLVGPLVFPAHLQVLENGHRIAVEGAERVLAALEGKYIRSYPYAGYDVEHRH